MCKLAIAAGRSAVHQQDIRRDSRHGGGLRPAGGACRGGGASTGRGQRRTAIRIRTGRRPTRPDPAPFPAHWRRLPTRMPILLIVLLLLFKLFWVHCRAIDFETFD